MGPPKYFGTIVACNRAWFTCVWIGRDTTLHHPHRDKRQACLWLAIRMIAHLSIFSVIDGLQTVCNRDPLSLKRCHSQSVQIPIDRFADNLASIFACIRQRYPSAGIILISPGQCIPSLSNTMNKRLGMSDELVRQHRRSNTNAKAYMERAKQVCDDKEVCFVDAWTEFERAIASGVRPERLLPDGLHWSATAFAVSSFHSTWLYIWLSECFHS